MMLKLRGWTVAVVAVAATTASMAQQHRPDLNAFINKKVYSTAELVNQAKSDASVMDRYMRHFSMSSSEVVNYLSTLKLGKLQSDGIYKIYSVPDGGYVKAHVGKLKKGTKMFFAPDGSPALVWLCGNPVVDGKDTTLVPMTAGSVDQTVSEVAPLTVEPAPVTQEAFVPEVTPNDPNVPTVSVPDKGTEKLVKRRDNVSIIPFAGLAGLGIVGISNRGGGGEPVPEPATMAVLGLGAAALIRRRKVAAK
jgi:hypothetical protein